MEIRREHAGRRRGWDGEERSHPPIGFPKWEKWERRIGLAVSDRTGTLFHVHVVSGIPQFPQLKGGVHK